MSVVIGLTGGIGSGKSTVSGLFKALNVSVIDADVVARQVVAKGQMALKKIHDYFGPDILIEGELNRPKLREIIFADPEKKNWLNKLLHPLIREQMLTQLADAKGDYVILEAPLLFENKLETYCDYVVVVDIDEQVQVKRASARDNNSIEQIKAIINSQIERQLRLQKANFVIENSTISLLQLEKSVIALDKQLRALQ
ncbi:dephospho-CoA kinase [Psychromonas marina]|uniref:Dephospho-CoA kinase n=1 Tax=Psychromonas marina TaxID=88364 RepID=A0ABQ6DXM6_9GAMM|nr:dephospho-CoA kinase [Psychromonas marina]GLS89847.1 dephospho-CoA kinase [Psychromonas marina]